MEVLAVEQLSVAYQSTLVLKNVSFHLESGDFLGIVGHNGSGKTTLLKTILGLLPTSTGTIQLFSQSLDSFRDWQKIGYLPQNITLANPLFPATVEEVIRLGRLAGKLFPKRFSQQDNMAVQTALEEFKIANLRHQFIGSLSGGQQQRVFLAKAFVNNPDLLIFDEPSTALDTESQTQLFHLLRERHQQRGTTIIFVTHDICQVGRYANKLLYLDNSVQFFGTLAEFCQSDTMLHKFGTEVQHALQPHHDHLANGENHL